MKISKKICCDECNTILSKDEIALNKKLIAPEPEKFFCLECMSLCFGCEVDDLRTKIDEFKEQGCTLFL